MKALDTYFKAEKGRLSRCAEETGLSPSFLSRIASGQREPGFTNLKAIARATGLSLDELAAPEPPKSKRKQGERA